MRTVVDLVKIRVGQLYLSSAHVTSHKLAWVTVTRIKSYKERRQHEVRSFLRNAGVSLASHNLINDKLIHAKHRTVTFFNARNVPWSYAGKFLSALYTNPLYLRKDRAGISLAKSLLRGWIHALYQGKISSLISNEISPDVQSPV